MIVNRLFGIPLEFYYAIGIALIIWYVLEYTAIGRRILFVGRGREVARLSGINTDRVRIACLVASGFLGALGRRALHRHAGRRRSGFRRVLSIAGLRRRLPRIDLHRAGPLQSLGHDGRGLFPRDWHYRPRLSRLQSFIQEMFYGGALVIAVTLSQLVRGRQEQQF